MSKNLKVYEQVRAVPPEALKSITGGRLKGMSDINPMWRIKTLTETFGVCGFGWKTVITDRRLERGHADEVVCFVDIHLFVKMDGEWSEPIEGTGGSSFVTQEKNGVHTSDECFKMAYTDALSVACKSLGVAADVYFAKDRTKYSQQEDREDKTNQPPRQATKGEIKSKWMVLGKPENEFEDWYKARAEEKYDNNRMNNFLAKKLLEQKESA